MTNISIEIKGLKQLEKALVKSPEIAIAELNQAIKVSLLKLQASAIKKTPVDRGFLRNSHKTTFKNLIGELRNTAPYAAAVHEGTKPHFPPYQPGSSLEKWGNRKGIPPFLVARKIGREGTKGVPFYDDAIKDTKTFIDSAFDSALNRIVLKIANL